MMNALRSPLNTNTLAPMPINASTTMLPPTRPTMAHKAASPKKAGARKASTARRPAHGMNGVSIIVSRRDRLSSRMRVPKMAGTLQPKPRMRGMHDLPCRPIQCM